MKQPQPHHPRLTSHRTQTAPRPRLATIVAVEALTWIFIAAVEATYLSVALPLLGLPGLRGIPGWFAVAQPAEQWVPPAIVLAVLARAAWSFGDSGLLSRLSLPRPYPLARTKLRILACIFAAGAAAVTGRSLVPLLAGRSWLWPVLAGTAIAVLHNLFREHRRARPHADAA